MTSRRRAFIAFASTAAIAEATHVFQQKLLARPVHRNYVDPMKRQHAGQ